MRLVKENAYRPGRIQGILLICQDAIKLEQGFGER